MSQSEPVEDPIAHVRENEESLEAIADRNDQLGAAARVLLALARDEQPSRTDLHAAGLSTLAEWDSGEGQ